MWQAGKGGPQLTQDGLLGIYKKEAMVYTLHIHHDVQPPPELSLRPLGDAGLGWKKGLAGAGTTARRAHSA